MSHFYDGSRTWKQWWWFVRYWLRCLTKDIERAKYDWEDQVEGGLPWRTIYGPRMMITYHKSPGGSVASRMTSQRVMPLENIYDFTIGNFKKVLGIPSAEEKISRVYAPRVKGNPPAMDIRQIIADSDIKDFIHGPTKKDH